MLVYHSIKNLEFGTLSRSAPADSGASLVRTLLDAKSDKIVLFERPG